MSTAVGSAGATVTGPTASRTRDANWQRRLVLLASCVLLLAAAAPWIAARWPMRAWLLSGVSRALGLRGSLSSANASLGWFSPLRLRGLTWTDEQGEPLLQIAEISTSRTLIGLIWNRSALGTVRIEQPVLRLVYLEDRTNLEDALGDLLAGIDSPSGSGSGLTCRIEVHGGEVQIVDPSAKREWNLREVGALVELGTQQAPLLLELQAKSDGSSRKRPCRLQLALTRAAAGEEPPSDSTGADLPASSEGDRLECSLHRLPLAPLAPLLRRSLPGARLEGELSASLQCELLAASGEGITAGAAGPSTAGPGTAAKGTAGQGTAGQGTVGQGTPAGGTVGKDTAGQDTPARGTPARGTPGKDTTGRGAPARDTAGQGTTAVAVHEMGAGESASSPHFVLPVRGSLKAKLGATDLLLAAPALGPDALRLDAVEIPIELRWDEQQVEIRKLAAQCEVGKLSLSGHLPPVEEWLAAATTQALVSLVLRIRGGCEAEFDLARLAAIAPHTLCLRDEAEITSGQVRAALAANGSNGHTKLTAALEVTRLEGSVGRRHVVWEAPLAMNLLAVQKGDDWKVETLECRSDFLQLGASGTLDDCGAIASFDLAPLAQQLGQFVDLAGWQLGGTGQARFGCKRLEDGALDAAVELALQDFAFQVPGLEGMREPALKAEAQVTSMLQQNVLLQLDHAVVSIMAGEDRLTLRLLRPVARPLEAAHWPLELELAGEAARWLERARPFFGSEHQLALAGPLQLRARGTFGPEQGRLDEATLVWDRLELTAWGLHAREPRATLTAAGAWNVSQRRIELPEMVVRSSSLSGTVRGLKLAMPEGQPIEASGDLDLIVDLGRLSTWLAASGLVGDWQAEGRARLAGTLQSSGAAAAAELSGRIDGLVVASAGSQVWSDARVDLACKAGYLPAQDRLEIASLAIGGSTVQIDARGAVLDVTARPVLDAQGTYAYDAKALAAFIASYVRSPVILEDKQPRDFSLRVPLTGDEQSSWLESAQGDAALGWQGARVYGFALGPAAAQARLAEGRLRIEPFEVAVNDGRVRLAPELHLAATPMLLTHGSGRIIDQVRITPDMCREWLRYVAPVLSETAEAEGTFSVDLDGMHLPLDRPGALEAGGRVTLHSVQVAPTPLAQELGLLVLRVADLFRINLPGRRSADDLASLWSRPARVRLKRESQVAFRVAGGYVHHENVVLEFQDFTVRTRGSVGFDQTLSLVAEVPIRDDWLRSERLRNAFAGKVLQLPVGGTLGRPKVDLRGLERLASDLLREAASDALRGELDRQLERLLRPRR